MTVKDYYVYMMASSHNTALYLGVTSDLQSRVYQHKAKLVPGCTARYNLTKLVYYEVFSDPENAIFREKQIKTGSMRKKMELVDNMNRHWRDLYNEI